MHFRMSIANIRHYKVKCMIRLDLCENGVVVMQLLLMVYYVIRNNFKKIKLNNESKKRQK